MVPLARVVAKHLHSKDFIVVRNCLEFLIRVSEDEDSGVRTTDLVFVVLNYVLNYVLNMY